jgi:hypothetical protein
LTIEDSDFLASWIIVFEHESFYVNLQENSVYYMVSIKTDAVWDKNYNPHDCLSGLITDNRIVSILTHQAENAQEIMLLPPSLLIQKQ